MCFLRGADRILIYTYYLEEMQSLTQAIYFSRRFRPPEAHLTLNGRNILFVNHVKYLGVIFDKRITWRQHIEMTEAKAFRTFIRIYSLFKSKRSSANIILTLHKALTRSVMIYTCPASELVADIFLVKLRCLQNKVLRALETFQGARWSAICTWLSTFHMHTLI
jgi:hypothetical protein